jgi:hypothetical protein
VGALQRFEQRLESLVNGAFARAFKAEVQPVEIASALQRECDNRAVILSRDRTMVPNRFVVELSPSDSERLSIYAQSLRTELADVVREHAQEQRYALVGEVDVQFRREDDLDTGVFRVSSVAQGGPAGAPRADSPETRVHAAVPPGGGAAHEQPRPAPYLDIKGARFPLTGVVAVLGRGSDADVRIDDPGASRKHARITLTRGEARIADLGSTNGLVVDGEQVAEAALHDGSRIVIGATTAVYRSG